MNISATEHSQMPSEGERESVCVSVHSRIIVEYFMRHDTRISFYARWQKEKHLDVKRKIVVNSSAMFGLFINYVLFRASAVIPLNNF